jgi:DNA polymerase-3 subunit beta
MKLTFTKEAFSDALATVSGIVIHSAEQTIFRNVLLTADKVCELASHNALSCATAQFEARVFKPGAITLPAEKLTTILNGAPKGQTVGLSADNNRATVAWGRSKYPLPCLPVEDFPKMFEASGDPVALSVADMTNLFARPLAVLRKGDVRELFQGVWLHEVDGRLASLASDGHHILRVLSEAKFGARKPIMVSREAAASLSKGSGEACWNDRVFTLRGGGKSLSTTLLRAQWGDITSMIPPKEPALDFSREELHGALDRLSSVSDGKGIVRIEWEDRPKQAVISLVLKGEGTETVPCSGERQAGFFGLLCAPAAELIGSLPGQTISLAHQGGAKPVRIVAHAEPDTVAFMAPSNRV